MSRSTRAITNKYQKHPKVDIQQYLYNSGEPDDRTTTNGAINNYDPEQSDRYYQGMRSQIRYDARQLRAAKNRLY